MPADLKPFDQVKLYISHSHSSRDRLLVFDLANYLEKKLSKEIGKNVGSSLLTATLIALLKEVSKPFEALWRAWIKKMRLKGYTTERLEKMGFRLDLAPISIDYNLDSGKRAVEIAYDRRMITADTDTSWHETDQVALKTANLFLLMVSPDYLKSFHCMLLMTRLKSREERGLATVIPIILRPTEKSFLFSGLFPLSKQWTRLPKNGQAVTDWPDPEAAFADILEGILRAIPARVRRVWVEKKPPKGAIQREGDPTKPDNQVMLGPGCTRKRFARQRIRRPFCCLYTPLRGVRE